MQNMATHLNPGKTFVQVTTVNKIISLLKNSQGNEDITLLFKWEQSSCTILCKGIYEIN